MRATTPGWAEPGAWELIFPNRHRGGAPKWSTAGGRERRSRDAMNHESEVPEKGETKGDYRNSADVTLMRPTSEPCEQVVRKVICPCEFTPFGLATRPLPLGAIQIDPGTSTISFVS